MICPFFVRLFYSFSKLQFYIIHRIFAIEIREKKAWGIIDIKYSVLVNSICVKSLRWFPKSSNDDHLGGGSVKNVVVLRFKIYTYFYLLPSTSLDVFGCIKTCILTLGCSLDGLILLRFLSTSSSLFLTLGIGIVYRYDYYCIIERVMGDWIKDKMKGAVTNHWIKTDNDLNNRDQL